jgi:radical SAM-linked protein
VRQASSPGPGAAPDAQPSAGQPSAGHRLRVRYAKRGRLRFASHRDIARAVERAVRRAGLPIAYSAGFSPHPKISYAGAAPTGVASEAEYLELTLTTAVETVDVRDRLDAALPDGLDVIYVTEANSGQLVSELEASEWEVELPGVQQDAVAAACTVFLAAGCVEIERLTNKGVRRMDARSPVATLEPGRRANAQKGAGCAILRMVVRHVTPAVRPDDVLAALRQVSGLVAPSPPLVTRLAQGPRGAVAGGLAEPRPAVFRAADDEAADRGAPRGSGATGEPEPRGRAAETGIASPGAAATREGGATQGTRRR